MQTLEITVVNRSGLHARPAAMFVEAASGFDSRITIENLDRNTRPVDATSILMVLTAGVQSGHRVRLTADGPDEDDALRSLGELIASGLGEEPGTG